jgi:uncharacterized protein YkwD
MKAKMFRALLPMAFMFIMISCSSDSASVETEELQAKEYAYSQGEIDLMSKINSYRKAMGLNELLPIEHISYKSFEHNNYMIDNEVVGHQYFESRAANIKQVLGAVRVSENIAYNYQSNAGVLNAWLNSEGHKVNIEGDYTHFGIAITEDPVTGRKYYTNIFMKR